MPGAWPPSRQANAKTLTVMMQEQLDAINEEIRWVILNSGPQKLYCFCVGCCSPTSAGSVIRKKDGQEVGERKHKLETAGMGWSPPR